MSLYKAPDDFVERLDREFEGRLRIRWSNRQQCWMVEQKIRRSLADQMPPIPNSDSHTRNRDGYMLVLEVRPGDRMPCPTCGTELKVPVFEIGSVICDFCQRNNNIFQYFAGFFELNDRLLEYLRYIDPDRGASKRLRNRVDDHNRRVEAAQERMVLDPLDAAVRDDFNKLAGIPTVYYGR